MKNPETLCLYKRSSISDACKFFYLWLFSSHKQHAVCYKKSHSWEKNKHATFCSPELPLPCSLCHSQNKWLGVLRGFGETARPCFMSWSTDAFACRFLPNGQGPIYLKDLIEVPCFMFQQSMELHPPLCPTHCLCLQAAGSSFFGPQGEVV